MFAPSFFLLSQTQWHNTIKSVTARLLCWNLDKVIPQETMARPGNAVVAGIKSWSITIGHRLLLTQWHAAVRPRSVWWHTRSVCYWSPVSRLLGTCICSLSVILLSYIRIILSVELSLARQRKTAALAPRTGKGVIWSMTERWRVSVKTRAVFPSDLCRPVQCVTQTQWHVSTPVRETDPPSPSLLPGRKYRKLAKYQSK